MPLESIKNDYGFHPYVLPTGDMGFPFKESYDVLFTLKVCNSYRERSEILEIENGNLEKIIAFERSINAGLEDEKIAWANKRKYEQKQNTILTVIGVSSAGLGGLLLGAVFMAILKR
jgi:hypothetical protein